MRHCGFDHIEVAIDVGLKCSVPLLFGKLFETPLDAAEMRRY